MPVAAPPVIHDNATVSLPSIRRALLLLALAHSPIAALALDRPDSLTTAAAVRVERAPVLDGRDDDAAWQAAPVIDATEAACQQLGLRWQRMVSRAYHDSLFMAGLFSTGMIFIPCRGGVSHRPDEYASPEAIKNGVEVLALTMARLSN